MTFHAIDAWWWHALFILVAGWLATDLWRFAGVYFGGRLRDDSTLLVFVRTTATGLVAAVIGNLVVFPSGDLAATPLALRLAALGAGFAVYLGAGRRLLLGIAVAEAVLAAGLLLGL